MIAVIHPITGLPLGDIDPATPGLPGWVRAQIDDARQAADADADALERELCEAARAKVAGGDPDVPADGLELWRAFWLMHGFRQHGPAGWQALLPSEMERWAAMTGATIGAAGWRTLLAMDRAFLSATADPESGERPPLTADLFDAMFG